MHVVGEHLLSVELAMVLVRRLLANAGWAELIAVFLDVRDRCIAPLQFIIT